MTKPVIRVEKVGKRYVLGRQQTGRRYRALRDDLMDAVKAPWRWARRGLGSHDSPSQEEDFWALQDVGFEVGQGEVVGIIGRNGAGKSTLLKILSRITEPTTGRITLKGRVASLLEVGTGFHPELTGRENIFLNGAILGMHRSEIKAKFDEIVAFAEVEKFLDTPVKRYSSGMYVRLAFAVAAHLEPEILIVDEVLAVGDAEFQKKCLGKMQDVAQGQGRTVLFVSHNMGAVQQLCSKILFMESGQTKRIGDDVRAIIQEYLSNPEDQEALSLWSNPGDQYTSPLFHPVRFQIVDATGNVLFGPTAGDTEIWIEIEARIEQLDPALTIGYDIYTQEGELLYRSYHTDSASEHWPILSTSTIKLRSRLPYRFFNEGIYKVEMVGGLHGRLWLLEPGKGVPTIYLNIQGGLSDSPLWNSRRPGLLAPVQLWERVDK